MKSPHFLPSEGHIPLLKAALLPPEEAVKYWKLWASTVKINDIDAASFRIVAHAVHNLRDSKLDGPVWDRVKGVYRQNWVRSQRLSYVGSWIINGFEKVGVRAVLL